MSSQDDKFEHHGIKGQKWGVRRTPEQLGYSKSDSPMTKREKKDYNSMDNREFKGKYGVSKKKYAKRVEKYGNPYMNSPYSKRLQRKHSKELAAQDDKARTEMWYNRDQYTTKQLREMNDRMQTEINYKNNLDKLHPETASRETTRKYARMFATSVAGFIVAKASTDLGKFIYSQGKDAVIEALRHGDDASIRQERRNTMDTFEHHGIKGQKWGVRRTRQQLGYKFKNSKALGMYGGDRKKNREALKDMRTRISNNKEGLNKVKSLDRASATEHALGNMFGGDVGIFLHIAGEADRRRSGDAYTDVRNKAYEETKQKYGEDAANRALRHQKKVERRVKVALGAAIVASTVFATVDANRTMNGGRLRV